MNSCVRIIIFLLMTSSAYSTPHEHLPLFSLHTTATWKEYSLKSSKIQFIKEKWAWAYSLILKSKSPIKLNNLTLQWNGDKIDNLSASLYQKKEREKVVIPIQKNLVCDGSWDSKRQQMRFPINEKIVATNKYHMLLSFPKNIEHALKKGLFVISGTQATGIAKPLKIATRTCTIHG